MMSRYRTWYFPLVLITLTIEAYSQSVSRWSLTPDQGIQWAVEENHTHLDHIEMSGFQLSGIVYYVVQDGILDLALHLVFPMLRTIPNDTHASLAIDIDYEDLPPLKVNGRILTESPERIHIKGLLTIRSRTTGGLIITHRLFPSAGKPVFIDLIEIQNVTNETVMLELPHVDDTYQTPESEGVYGAYHITTMSGMRGNATLDAGETLTYALTFSALRSDQETPDISPEDELKKRLDLVDDTFTSLSFECHDPVINRLFAFAKLRAVESIYETSGGLMHGPGGGRYYAAIWANDQAEYANPFFPFLGNAVGNESAINSFRPFAAYMNPEYQPIPSSIIAEGTDYWNGAGDRGDMAMIAYGAARFALAYGDRTTASELWPLIQWCLEYCRRNINSDGIVKSDSDELEGRFPAGDANLNTSCLYYDALISAVYLGRELDMDPSILDEYTAGAESIRTAIEEFFGRNVAGYDTYRYYEGNDILRAWICTPLTVGIYDRKNATIEALFSEQLWTADGLASATGSTTFWDRATLYALRGVFAAGESEKALSFLKAYSQRRLLGEHVPYPVEAYPEGNQRHLSAESALYCRIITEGIFGIRSTGFNSFLLTPNLPAEWNSMSLRNINAFGQTFSIDVNKTENKLQVRVFNKETIFHNSTIIIGETIIIKFI